ncbi:MAG: GGDEF domain-containing protein [Terracidiphilus sp.]
MEPGAILDLLGREINRASRSQTTIGLLMLDVDHFKRINDTDGNLVGDVVLREIALRISKVVRAYDSVGRYGGEEFLIVLPGCNREQVLQSAERIRSMIAERPISADGKKIAATISIGATTSSSSTASAMQMLRVADDSLYKAKTEGRNRMAECDLEICI